MTKYEICNMALFNIGVTRIISNFTDNLTEAALCGRFYDIAKETVLKAHEWKFANLYASDTLTVTDETNDKYRYVYEYPDDALRLTAVYPDGCLDMQLPYDVITIVDENSDTVKRVVCDIENAKANYIVDISEDCMPSAFIEALSWKISTLIATGLSKTPQMLQTCMQMHSATLSQSIYQNNLEGKKEKEVPRYIAARRGVRHGNI